MRARTHALTSALVACSALASCDETQPQEKSIERTQSVELASELLDDDEVREQLPFLAEQDIDLCLNVPAERIGDADLAALIREAADLDIRVRAWLVIDRKDGYWANEHNVQAVRKAAEAFADWRKDEDLPVDWVVLDMETGYDRYVALNETKSTEEYALALATGKDPEAFASAKQAYVELVEDLHERGLKVGATSFPQLLEDPSDCDEDLQDAYDIPLSGIPWDEVNFMVYQSGFSETFDKYFGPDLVQAYADLAHEQYGKRASISLGIIGAAGVLPVTYPYRSPKDLTADRAAVAAAGIQHVNIFALDTVKDQTDPSAWLVPDVKAKRYAISESVKEVRSSLQDLDAFLGAGTCD